MSWLIRHVFGSHVSGWPWLAIVILLSFALGVALLKLVFWLLTRERNVDEIEKEYWRIHGG